MITVQNPDTQHIPTGEILWGHTLKTKLFLNKLDGYEGKFEEQIVFDLTTICFNPIDALSYMDISTNFFDTSKFSDLYTGYSSRGIVPIAILTDDIMKYKPSLQRNRVPFLDLILDREWHKDRLGDELLPELSKVGSILLGTGYMHGCSINDGHPELQKARLKLSNGDWIYVAFWEWYNK